MDRSSFALADMEREGGLSPHISPMTNVSDVGGLLQSAGFALPTVDVDVFVCPYPDMFTLMNHLSGMGETNCALSRRSHVSAEVFSAAAAIYDELYRDADTQLIPATFQVIYMIGWAPDSSQRQPLARGSAKASMTTLDKRSSDEDAS